MGFYQSLAGDISCKRNFDKHGTSALFNKEGIFSLLGKVLTRQGWHQHKPQAVCEPFTEPAHRRPRRPRAEWVALAIRQVPLRFRQEKSVWLRGSLPHSCGCPLNGRPFSALMGPFIKPLANSAAIIAGKACGDLPLLLSVPTGA